MDLKEIAKKWQKKWEDAKIFEVKEDPKKKKFYMLEMFPYPSGSGLHMGHAFNYTIGDIFARFKRMQGFNVLYPMGYDSLGLPAENAAIKEGTHPKKYTDTSILNFIKQQKALGLSYDWTRTFKTHDPKYYKWDQWIFLEMLKKGLAYRKKAPVNWCSECQSVLANEQVHNGFCWRHPKCVVEVKQLEQWFLKITDYAEELYNGIELLTGWADDVKAMQKNWIGKSFGTEIAFEINGKNWTIFTTRPDTVYGVTFMVVSAQHPRLMELVTKEQKKEVDAFLKKLKSTSEKDLGDFEKDGVFTGSYAVNPLTNDKVPVYAGNFVIAEYGSGMVMAVPAHDQRDFEFAKKYNLPIKQVIIPIYGESRKDSEFRKTISAVVKRKSDGKFLFIKWKKDNWISPPIGGVEEGEDIGKAAEREVLEETGYKTKFVKILGGLLESNFFASHKNIWRQRHDQPVLLELLDEKPVEISAKEKELHEVIWLTAEEAYKKTTHPYNTVGLSIHQKGDSAYVNDGNLINSGEFTGMSNAEAKEKISKYLEKKNLGKRTVQFKLKDWLVSRQRYWGTPIPVIYCDKCGIVPDTNLPVELPEKVTFGVGNPLETNKEFVNVSCPNCKGKARRETDTMDTFVNSSWYHLRYADPKNDKEIFDKKKAAYWLPIDQYIGGREHACMHLIYFRFYTKFLRDIGLLTIDEPTLNVFNQGLILGADGEKMSKSRGNVVNPLEIIDKYSSDALRLYLISNASPDKNFMWNDKGVDASGKILQRTFALFEKRRADSDKRLKNKVHRTIKEITKNIQHFEYNKSIITLTAYIDYLSGLDTVSEESLETLALLFAPFTPHLSEELWEKLKHKDFISLEQWPKFEEKYIDDEIEFSEQALGSLVSDIHSILKLTNITQPKKIKLIISEQWKYDYITQLKNILTKTFDASKVMKEILSGDLKKYGQEISKMTPRLVADQSKIPLVVTNQEKELIALRDSQKKLEETFKCTVVLEKAEQSKEAKAKQAMPGKPALVIE